MKTITVLAVFLGGAASSLAEGPNQGCKASAASLGSAVAAVKSDSAKVVGLVEQAVSASPDCSCELVRSAIAQAKAKPAVVGQMVDAAIKAAPDKAEIVVMCALATDPDAWSEIIKVAEKYNLSPNPLDFPSLKGNPQILLAPNVTLYVSPNQVTIVDSK